MRPGRKQDSHVTRTASVIAAAFLAVAAQGCATSRVEQVTANEFAMSTLASPICDTAGQKKAQLKGVAVQTLESGFDRFRVFAEDDSGTALASEIDFSGALSLAGKDTSGLTPIPVHVANLKLRVKMFRDGEPGAAGAISAREVLGPGWKNELNKEKSWTCTS
jgi:hypothetical protein